MKWLLIAFALLLCPAAAKADPCAGRLPDRAGQTFSGVVRYVGDGDSLCVGGQLALTWTERGGPPVVAPAKSGFGSKLIRRGLTGAGGAELTYDPDGFSAVFSAPVVRLKDD